MQRSKDERSLGELFADLSRELSTLIRDEVALAKTEMSDKATKVGKNVGFIAAGGAILYAGMLAILAAIIILIAKLIAWWLSALVVGIVVAAIGFFLVDKGIQALRSINPTPKQTVESLKEDREWMKEQV